MKLKIFLILFISLLSFSISAQTTISDIKTEDVISDSDAPDFETLTGAKFAERTVTGKVVGVHDGDTATVLDSDKVQYKFRFNGIDAPELKMDFGQKSKQNLSDMIFGKTVTVKFSKKDKYGRFVGNIFIDGKDVNLEQVKAGMAWHYKKYSDEQTEVDRKLYSDAEIKAREAKLGFWSMPSPTPPWDYRAKTREQQAADRADRKYMVGPKGGCYYLNSSGEKKYVEKKFCEGLSAEKKAEKPKEEKQAEKPKAEPKTDQPKEDAKKDEKADQKPSSDGRTYILGPKGGCYYMDGDKKVYVKDKSKCGTQ